jgi:hypothetical protein
MLMSAFSQYVLEKAQAKTGLSTNVIVGYALQAAFGIGSAILFFVALFFVFSDYFGFGGTTTSIGMFLIGLCTVAQLSFWGNYLPHVYPVHLRGTGESFAANIGGRLIGTFAALITWSLSGLLPFPDGPTKGPLQFSTAAAIVGTSIALIGLAASFLLQEPSEKAIEE